MKLIVLLGFLLLAVFTSYAQRIDTLIDVEGCKLHFNITKGNGIPIVFESGLGDNATIWDTILPLLHKTTGTTLITYDRPGYGTSAAPVDTSQVLMNGVRALEKGLTKLGYNGDIMLVCHSYGGICGTLYAARHPAIVKYAVMLDASLATVYDDAFLKMFAEQPVDTSMEPGFYYEVVSFVQSINLMRKIKFPSHIPVTDIIAGLHSPEEPIEETLNWEKCHRAFVAEQPNRTLITATESGHHIMIDSPSLVIDAISKAYSKINSK